MCDPRHSDMGIGCLRCKPKHRVSAITELVTYLDGIVVGLETRYHFNDPGPGASERCFLQLHSHRTSLL
jgi:hypothetical protein